MKFGLSVPTMAKFDSITETYSEGFICGEAMTTSIKPNYNEGSVRADNRTVKYKKKFKDADVTIGVSRLPKVAKVVVFGHEFNFETGEEISSAGDDANNIGYGFKSNEDIDGEDKIVACILHNVKFVEGEDAYETEGENIVFKTPVLTGKAVSLKNGVWRTKRIFDTEEAAQEWIESVFGMKQQCKKPEASVVGGTFTEEQNIALSCGTQDAKIFYTINGIVPTKTTGTEYMAEIAVTESTSIMAIAVKDGCIDSDLFKQEYFIKTV